MVKANGAVVVEVDGPRNENLFFRPLSRKIRGKFDVRRIDEPGPLLRKWPDVIPGQRISLDPATGDGEIIEPLYDDEHQTTRERIEKKGMKLEPRRQPFKADVATWLFWMLGAVQSNLAHVVEGEFPSQIEGTPQTSFITTRPVDPMERLAVAIEKQNELMLQLLAKKG